MLQAGEAHNRIDGYQIKGEFRHKNLPQHRNDYDDGCEDNQKIADDIFDNLRTLHTVIPSFKIQVFVSVRAHTVLK